jgi:tetratricopeptide (TPR) repeat protein
VQRELHLRLALRSYETGMTMTRGPDSTDASASARARFTAACLLNAGRAVEAERFTSSQIARNGGDGFQFYLGQAHAKQGKIDEAVRVFLELLTKNPHDESVRHDAIALLHKQAVQKINVKDWSGAGSALGDALKIDPGNQEILRLLSRVDNVLPVAYLRMERRRDAAEAWEKTQRQTPENGRVAHSLSLLYGYWAMALERQGEVAKADHLWQQAMGNWVLVRYNDAFWVQWAAQRQAIYPIPTGAIETLRETWSSTFLKWFRQSAGESVGPSTRPDPARRRMLEMQYWLERTTASALYELKKIRCPHCLQFTAGISGPGGLSICGQSACRQPLTSYQPPHEVTPCGPIMLRHFALEEQVREVVIKSPQLANGKTLSGDLAKLSLPFVKRNSDVLDYCVSVHGLAFALAANRKFEEAIDLLERP